MLPCYVLTLFHLHVWCLALVIHEMIAINEITDHQNGCYRVAKMSSHALAEKMFEKYQRISANFSNCDEVYFQKRIIIKSGECALKITLPQLFFYIAALISSKLCPVHRNNFPIYCSGEIFLFIWLFLMKGAVGQHSYVM